MAAAGVPHSVGKRPGRMAALACFVVPVVGGPCWLVHRVDIPTWSWSGVAISELFSMRDIWILEDKKKKER